ncbi:hypothetical protein WR25_14685 [Diploscapter pachys]|uniref:EF-hand domain-containing protein n=1 Tax=Diploscapter pachys TaxID=2018661 RepID=A0A2A2JGE5_9BILA|nr:hypothetical protein WR25_14685 [Diploscapter pachys]
MQLAPNADDMQRKTSRMEALKECELREIFKEFDKNGDGKINRQELEVALLQFGENPTGGKIEALIEQADIDGNGCIDIDEFLLVLKKQLISPKEERELREVFNVFDKDQDGMISLGDLLDIMGSLGEKLTEVEAKLMIREADRNSDGKIDFHEFAMLIKGN